MVFPQLPLCSSWSTCFSELLELESTWTYCDNDILLLESECKHTKPSTNREKKKKKWFLSQSICNVSRAQVYRIAMGLDEYLTKKAHHVGVARGALLSCRKCGETLIRWVKGSWSALVLFLFSALRSTHECSERPILWQYPKLIWSDMVRNCVPCSF